MLAPEHHHPCFQRRSLSSDSGGYWLGTSCCGVSKEITTESQLLSSASAAASPVAFPECARDALFA